MHFHFYDRHHAGSLSAMRNYSSYLRISVFRKDKLKMYIYKFVSQNKLNTTRVHDDVIKWKHFPRYWPFVRGIHRSPVNSPHRGEWRGASMLSLICSWINGWVNNREAGDLRRHRAHYDVIVMLIKHWRRAYLDTEVVVDEELETAPLLIEGLGAVLSKRKTMEHHDDVIKWKHFPRFWPFVRGIHRSPVNSPHKGQWRGALMFPLIRAWINSYLRRSLWRHCNDCGLNLIQLNGPWVKSPIGYSNGFFLLNFVAYFNMNYCDIKSS